MLYSVWKMPQYGNGYFNFYLTEVYENDKISNTKLDMSKVQYPGYVQGMSMTSPNLNTFINDQNQLCIESIPVPYLFNSTFETVIIPFNGSYMSTCRDSLNVWRNDQAYSYGDNDYFPYKKEFGVWQYFGVFDEGLLAGRKERILQFLDTNFSTPSFDDFNITQISHDYGETFKVYDTYVTPFVKNNSVNENILLGVNYINDADYRYQNDMNMSLTIQHYQLFSLIHKNGEWHYSELMHSDENGSFTESNFIYTTLTAGYEYIYPFLLSKVLTEDGPRLFAEYNNYQNGEKELFVIDIDQNGDISLIDAQNTYGELFETVYWKQRPRSYRNGIMMVNQKNGPRMAIDPLGRYHIHENEGTDTEPVYYYNVYDSRAATPQTPTVHQYIGGCPNGVQ
jgi:hypothetical protein